MAQSSSTALHPGQYVGMFVSTSVLHLRRNPQIRGLFPQTTSTIPIPIVLNATGCFPFGPSPSQTHVHTKLRLFSHPSNSLSSTLTPFTVGL
jgi:hypothetical protein